MKKLRMLHGFVVLGTAAAATFFFLQGDWLAPTPGTDTATRLHQLKQYDVALNQEALKVRAGLVLHYDPLVQASNRVEGEVILLQDAASGIVGKGGADVDQLVKQYAQLHGRRSTIIERFKAKNSTLRNSLFYFPSASTLFIKNAQAKNASPELIVTVEQMLQDLLSFYVNGNQGLQARVQSHLHEVSRLSDDAPESLQGEITGLMKHAGIVLRHKRQVDEMLSQLTSPESLSVLDSLIHVFEERQAAGEKTAEMTRAGFYVSTTFLVCYLLFLMVGLLRKDDDREGNRPVIAGRPVLASERAA